MFVVDCCLSVVVCSLLFVVWRVSLFVVGCCWCGVSCVVCVLCVVCYSLLVFGERCCVPFVVYGCSVFVVCRLLCVVCRLLLRVVVCMLCVGWFLRVVCGLLLLRICACLALFVVRCVLFVVC